MNFSKSLDTLLDRTVVLGYTKIGYELRKRQWSELPRMDGKIVLVTGATSGLGLAAAEGFAALGATVHLLARNESRGQVAVEQVVRSTGNRSVSLELCDLSDLSAVRAFAADFTTRADRLDVLVNNAGLLLNKRELSVDGIELTFATNVLGPFLLTNLLIELLKKSAPARIITVSSGGMYSRKLPIDDLQSERLEKWDGAAVYAGTKREQVVLSELWAEGLKNSGVVVHSLHPGWADTPGVKTSLPRFYRVTQPLLRTPGQGADTIVWLGVADEPGQSTGRFWHDRRARPTHLFKRTQETADERRELWEQCLQLSGSVDPIPKKMK